MFHKTLCLVGLLVAGGANAESITHGSTTINMDFVDIGYAGNAPDTAGFGAVDYDYRVGKYEVTLDQFDNACAADNRIGVGSEVDGQEDFWNDGTRTVGIGAPAVFTTFYKALKFCNWLTTGSAYDGAYQFNGSGVFQAVDREAAVLAYGKVYLLPTENEWYKAAYFKPDASGYSIYANGSDDVADLVHGTANGWNYNDSADGGYVNAAPNYTWETGFGAQEQNGTYDMMGNVFEWTESELGGDSDWSYYRVIRGGSFDSTQYAMSSSYRNGMNPLGYGSSVGFRVAAIPEPSCALLIAVISGFGVFVRRHFPRV